MCGKAGNFRLNKPPQYYGSFPHVNDRLNSFFLKRRAGKSRRRSIILCRRHSFHPSFIRCKVAAQGGEVWTSAACNDRGPATGTLIGVDPSKRIYPAMIGRLCPDPPARRYGGRRRSCFTSTDLPRYRLRQAVLDLPPLRQRTALLQRGMSPPGLSSTAAPG